MQNVFLQYDWECPAPFTFPGMTCHSRCRVQGPGVPTRESMDCTADRTWQRPFPAEYCETVRPVWRPESGETVNYWYAPFPRTWTAALEQARQYTYGPNAGELAAVLSELVNSAVKNMIPATQEFAWLAGARDEVRLSTGAFWATGALRGRPFFLGTYQLNGTSVPGMYSTFKPNQPDNTGGALAIHSDDGAWCAV